jgi:hypothetical protein
LGEEAGGGEQWPELGWRDGGGEGGEVGVAGPGEGFGCVWRGGKRRVRTVERATLDMKVAGAGDAAVGIPTTSGDEAIKEQRLEGRARGREGAGGFG